VRGKASESEAKLLSSEMAGQEKEIWRLEGEVRSLELELQRASIKEGTVEPLKRQGLVVNEKHWQEERRHGP